MSNTVIQDGTNWYAYVGNDPINFIDPLGLCSESTKDTWKAQVIEGSITVQAVGENVTMSSIAAQVLFQNLTDTSDPSITANYTAYVTGSISYTAGGSASLEIGTAFAQLDSDIDVEEVPNTWTQKFNNNNVAVTVPTPIPGVSAGMSMTEFSSPDGTWQGYSGGPTGGVGATSISITQSETYYDLVGTPRVNDSPDPAFRSKGDFVNRNKPVDTTSSRNGSR